MKKPIWEGVYPSFADVPGTGPGMNGSTWVNSCLEKAKRLRDLSEQTGYALPREGVLSLVTATTLAGQKSVRVLDFGGGIGFAYYGLRACLPAAAQLLLEVVDLPAICSTGRSFFRDKTDISFHESIDYLDHGPDIIHLGSALQYISDWKGLLGSLAAMQPRWIILTDILAGTIPTYASAQNYYDSRIPVWFFNESEVIQTVQDLGYTISYRADCLSPILGKTGAAPQDNFPEHLRAGMPLNMLFFGGNHT